MTLPSVATVFELPKKSMASDVAFWVDTPGSPAVGDRPGNVPGVLRTIGGSVSGITPAWLTSVPAFTTPPVVSYTLPVACSFTVDDGFAVTALCRIKSPAEVPVPVNAWTGARCVGDRHGRGHGDSMIRDRTHHGQARPIVAQQEPGRVVPHSVRVKRSELNYLVRCRRSRAAQIDKAAGKAEQAEGADRTRLENKKFQYRGGQILPG